MRTSPSEPASSEPSGFAALGVPAALVANLEALGYATPTAIQAAAVPEILASRDVLAEAPTGSGKTIAFGLGLLAALDVTRWGPQSLVLCPTRELATQIAGVLRQLARPIANVKVLVLCGGVPLLPQIASLRHGAHIVVGTPGRVGKHLRDGRLELSRVRTCVLDEADRMLDMGFGDEVLALVAACGQPRQTLLFSATLVGDVLRVSAAIQDAPRRVSAGQASVPQIAQAFVGLGEAQREDVAAAWLRTHAPGSALLFCNTRIACASLSAALVARGIDAAALHGDLEQPDRERVLARFAGGSVRVLVATDVAARGIDLAGLDAVVNIELPFDPEVYVHRIGRTGRAGATGVAVSLVGDDDLPRLHAIETFAGITAVLERAPEPDSDAPVVARRVTLCIHAGRRDKLRPGDILGACTGQGGIAAVHVGKIEVAERASYVAIDRELGATTLRYLQGVAIKGRRRHITRAT